MFDQSKHRNISEEQIFRLHRCASLKSSKTGVAKKPQCVSFTPREGDEVITRAFSSIKNIQTRSQLFHGRSAEHHMLNLSHHLKFAASYRWQDV